MHPAQKPKPKNVQSSEFLDSLRKGLLIGAALLLVIVPPLRMHKAQEAQRLAQQRQAQAAAAPGSTAAAPQAPGPGEPTLRLADFRGEQPTPDARLMANWVLTTQDNGRHAFVLVDKKDARVYVFTPEGRLVDSAPALLGSARGDDTYPGVGDKPLSAVKPYEKTTPAGRFVAEMGVTTHKDDVIWVDYDAAVSMHRVRPFVAQERRLERLATATTDDNRISFGCINLPRTFYENVASPTVRQYGAVIYVLPDVKTVRQVFGAYDVTDPAQASAARDVSLRNTSPHTALQKVALDRSQGVAR